MRLKQPLLFIFLFFSFKTLCQEKFIEVTVSDTVWVKPNQFVYTIMYNPIFADDFESGRFNASSYQKKQTDIKSMQQRILDSTKKFLLKKGFYILPTNIYYAYTTSYESALNSVDILTSSQDSLQLIYNIISENARLSGKISSVSSNNEGEYESQLLRKLVNKATGKAMELAALSSMKIVSIVSLKEDPSVTKSGGWTAYPPLSALSTSMEPGWHTTITPRRYYSEGEQHVSGQYKIENTLVVRFAVQ